MSDLAEAYRAGYISHLPHFNVFSNYLMNPEMAWLLTRLVEISSLPLAEHEQEFSADSTGLTTDRYAKWMDEKEIARQRRVWLKLHIMCGRRSNIVTATVVTPSAEADGPQLGGLLEVTSRNFRPLQVAADGAYYSRENMLRVARVGGVPYFLIPRHSLPADGCLPSACNLVLYLYARNRADFFKNYYKRNNVETAFSMIRACLGTNLRSTSTVAQYNEAICKVICHNLRVLGRAMHEESVSPNFEPLSSYLARIEETTRALAKTIAGGRLSIPRKGSDQLSSTSRLLVDDAGGPQPDEQTQERRDEEPTDVGGSGAIQKEEEKKPARKRSSKTRRNEDQLTLFDI